MDFADYKVPRSVLGRTLAETDVVGLTGKVSGDIRIAFGITDASENLVVHRKIVVHSYVKVLTIVRQAAINGIVVREPALCRSGEKIEEFNGVGIKPIR